MNIAKLVKLARKVETLDEALEVLSLMGIEVETKRLPDDHLHLADQVSALIQESNVTGVQGYYRVDATVKGLPLRCLVIVGELPGRMRALPAAAEGVSVN